MTWEQAERLARQMMVRHLEYHLSTRGYPDPRSAEELEAAVQASARGSLRVQARRKVQGQA